MNLAILKTIVAAYLQRNTSDLTINGVDMFLRAANNVRRNLELLYDWEYSRVLANIDIDGITGGNLANAVIQLGVATNGIKQIVAVSRQRPDGTWIPLDFTRVDIPIERDRTELEFSDNLFPYLRYPSDAQINARGTTSSIVQRGNSLYIHPRFNNIPSTTYNVQLEAFGWLSHYSTANSMRTLTTSDTPVTFTLPVQQPYPQEPIDTATTGYPVTGVGTQWLTQLQIGDTLLTAGSHTLTVLWVVNDKLFYVASTPTVETNVSFSINGSDNPEDFLVEHGASYFQWAIICEMNFIFQTFIPRQEGIMAPPTQMRDDALRELTLWNYYMVDSNSTRSR